MKGRPPKPKHQLQLVGSKHAKNREELGELVASDLPEPPEWLSERAKEVFLGVAEHERDMGVLAKSDYNLLTRYAVVYTMWEAAAKQLQSVEMGYVETTNPDGSLKMTRATAAASQERACGEQLRHLETVLGLSPTDRTRMGYGATKVVNDPLAAWFPDDKSAKA